MAKQRDYKQEHERRKQKKTRLVADINKETAEQLTKELKAQGLTFIEWLTNKINEEIEKDL